MSTAPTPDEALVADLVRCLHAFGDVSIFEDWHAALDDEPPPEWIRIKTVELRKRIHDMGPILHRIRTEFPHLYPQEN